MNKQIQHLKEAVIVGDIIKIDGFYYIALPNVSTIGFVLLRRDGRVWDLNKTNPTRELEYITIFRPTDNIAYDCFICGKIDVDDLNKFEKIVI